MRPHGGKCLSGVPGVLVWPNFKTKHHTSAHAFFHFQIWQPMLSNYHIRQPFSFSHLCSRTQTVSPTQPQNKHTQCQPFALFLTHAQTYIHQAPAVDLRLTVWPSRLTRLGYLKRDETSSILSRCLKRDETSSISRDLTVMTVSNRLTGRFLILNGHGQKLWTVTRSNETRMVKICSTAGASHTLTLTHPWSLTHQIANKNKI